MNERILLVDDDPNLLAGLQRHLRKHFNTEAALNGPQALAMISSQEPYAVIVSDMRMPQMDGIQFLSQVRKIAPQSIRIMLTGNADQQTAIEAVNQGHIFRFLSKPCSPEDLVRTLEAGIEQYRLVTAEAELLEKTLTGSIGMMVEILSLADPKGFGCAMKLRNYVREMAPALGIQQTWQLELAAMLARIGDMALPMEIKAKIGTSCSLSGTEKEMLARVPEIGRNLLNKIPRLEAVAEIVRYQNQRFDGSGFPTQPIAGEDIPLGARIDLIRNRVIYGA